MKLPNYNSNKYFDYFILYKIKFLIHLLMVFAYLVCEDKVSFSYFKGKYLNYTYLNRLNGIFTR